MDDPGDPEQREYSGVNTGDTGSHPQGPRLNVVASMKPSPNADGF